MNTKNISVLLMLLAGGLAPLQAGAWGRFDGGHNPAYDPHWARHDPVVVHKTVVVDHHAGGCVGCGFGAGAVAGLVGGAILGAAIAGSAAAPPPTTVVEQAPPPVIVQQAAPPPVVVVQQGIPVGTQVATLPGGCASMSVNNVSYYQCGPTWYQPFFGANGVYYTVVPTP